MKKSIKNIVAGALLSSTLGMTACFGGAPTVKSVEIDNVSNNNYLVYDVFNPSDYVLNVTMSDGSTKTVEITSDMVKESPNMNSAGQKTFKVEYEGRIYEIKVNVGGYSKQEMLSKIQAFMADYNSKTNAGDVKVNIDGKYSAKYLDKASSGQIPNGEIEGVLQQSQFSGDQLLKHLYSSIVGSLTESSLDNVTLENIINSNNLHAKVDFIKVLEGLVNKVSDFNYASYIVDTFMASGGYSDFVENIAQEVCIGFNFEKNINVLEDVKSFINVTIRDFVEYVDSLGKENSNANFDAKEVLADFNDLVQKYSADDYTKTTCQTIFDSIEDNDPHAISNFFQAIADKNLQMIALYITEYDEESGMNFNRYVQNDETKAYNKKVACAISDAIRTFETIILNAFEEEAVVDNQLLEDFTNDVASFVKTVKEIEETEYKSHGFVEFAVHVEAVNETIINYQKSEDYIDFAVNQIKTLGLTQILAEAITDALVYDPEGQHADATEALNRSLVNIFNQILDAINGKEFTLDKDTYFEDIVKVVYNIGGENTIDPDKKAEYAEEWETTGFCSIISDYLNQIFADIQSTTEERELLDKMVEGIRYLENTLRTSGPDAVEFSIEEVFSKLNTILTDYRDMCQSKLEEIEEEMNNPQPEPDDDEGYNNITDYQGRIDYYQEQYDIFHSLSLITDFEDKEVTIKEFVNNISSCMSNLEDMFQRQLDELLEEDFDDTIVDDNGYNNLNDFYRRQEKLTENIELSHIISILTDFSDEDSTIKGNIDNLISEYKHEVKNGLTNILLRFMDIEYWVYVYEWNEEFQCEVFVDSYKNPEYDKIYNDVNYRVGYIVDKYLKGTLDYEYALNEFFKIIDKYAPEEMKVMSTAGAFIAMVTMDKLTEGEIDYNKLFSFVQLPTEIESVDFNKLVETFWSETTYKNMFNVSKVDVKYETDSQGNIAKEIMEVTLSFDYDLKITSISADLTLKFSIDF